MDGHYARTSHSSELPRARGQSEGSACGFPIWSAARNSDSHTGCPSGKLLELTRLNTYAGNSLTASLAEIGVEKHASIYRIAQFHYCQDALSGYLSYHWNGSPAGAPGHVDTAYCV